MSKQVKISQLLSPIATKEQRLLEPLKVLERYSPEVTEFETVEQFREFLSANKKEMDAMTTQKLNKTFKVHGYTITKLAGVISLKAARKNASVSPDVPSNVEQRISELEDRVDAIIKILNEKVLTTDE